MTKDIVIDLHQPRSALLVSNEGVDVKRMRTYKYLGLQLDDKLDWTVNINNLYKEGQSRLFLKVVT